MNTWVFPYIKQFRTRIILSLIIGFIGIGSGVMLLFMSGYLISSSALQPINIMAVYVPIVSVRAFSIGRAVFAYIEKLMSHDIVLRMLEGMRSALYSHLEPQALALQETYKSGDLLQVLSDDIEHLQDFYLRTIFPSVFGVILYAIICLVFGAFDWMFGLFLLLLLGIIVFLIPYVSLLRMRKKHEQMKEKDGELYTHVTDAFFGITDWKASGRTNEVINDVTSIDQERSMLFRSIDRFHIARDSVIQFVIGMAIIAVLIWTTDASTAGQFAPTFIAAFTLMIFSVTESFIPVSPALEEVPLYQDAVQRITRVEQNEPVNNASINDRNDYDADQINLQLHNVTFTYDGATHPAVQNVSLSIPMGKKIALLGKSGAGKSTLMQLIAGVLSPTEGAVTRNDKQYDQSILSKQIAVLNQKPHLFSTTIANNIRIGRPNASDEDVREAAKKAQLTDLIQSLPEGIDTNMLELGQRFSGGERQRIALARVLLQETPVLIVDEATIGLDPLTEYDLIDTILSATKDKTVIRITHHLAGAAAMDEIVFLTDGRITMQGSHQELMQTEPRYKQLYEMDQSV